MRIGVVVDYIVSEYNESLIKGAAQCCKDNDIELLIFEIGGILKTCKNFEYQRMSISAHIKKNNLDGIVFTSGTQVHEITQDDFISYLKSYKSIPIVNISNVIPEIPSVVVDCDEAYEALIEYIITKQESRKIAVMGVSSNSHEVENRTRIIKKVLANHKIPEEDCCFWKSNFEYSETYEMLSNMYNDGRKFEYDTIIALNDEMAYACIDFCTNELGLRVPEDVIITGFDDLQRASFSKPSLTSITQKVDKQSYLAVEILKDMIEGKEVKFVNKISTRAVLRESTWRIKGREPSDDMKDILCVETITDSLRRDKFSVSEWYHKRHEVVRAAYFYTKMQCDIVPEALNLPLTTVLKQYGFKAAAVVMYEKPIEMLEPFEYFNLPARAVLITAFDEATGLDVSINPTPIIFNPKETILPKDCFTFDSDGCIIEAIYHNTIQYGYIVLKKQDFDLPVYDIVSRAVSSQMAFCFNYLKLVNEQSMIKDRYKKMDLMAHTDELTGLSNRRGFMELGVTTMNFAQNIDGNGLVLYCDMNGLKKINDTYGHETGDAAIQAQGEILKSNFRSNDIIARLGGDEFAVICPGLKPDRLAVIKQNIDANCRNWEVENEVPFELSICFGSVEYPHPEAGYTLDELLSIADKDLYNVKAKYKAFKAANK